VSPEKMNAGITSCARACPALETTLETVARGVSEPVANEGFVLA